MSLLALVRDRLGHALHPRAAHAPAQVERRHAETRPKDGDTDTCPACAGVLLFQESYRIMRIERNTMEPAWVCHTHPCGYRVFLRH